MQIGAQLSRKTAKGCGFDFAVPEWHRDFYSKCITSERIGSVEQKAADKCVHEYNAV